MPSSTSLRQRMSKPGRVVGATPPQAYFPSVPVAPPSFGFVRCAYAR